MIWTSRFIKLIGPAKVAAVVALGWNFTVLLAYYTKPQILLWIQDHEFENIQFINMNSLQKFVLWFFEFINTTSYSILVLNLMSQIQNIEFFFIFSNEFISWNHIYDFVFVNSKSVHMNSYRNSYSYEFIYILRIYTDTYEFIYMNSYTHKLIWSFHIWIHEFI